MVDWNHTPIKISLWMSVRVNEILLDKFLCKAYCKYALYWQKEATFPYKRKKLLLKIECTERRVEKTSKMKKKKKKNREYYSIDIILCS